MISCESDLGGGWGYSVYMASGRKLQAGEFFGGSTVGGYEVVDRQVDDDGGVVL